jgi:Tfp pilus assembly protein PilV
MIEVLISLTVVSMGLAGILLAQGRTSVHTHGAGYRLQASLLAQQILDRARSNPRQRYTTGSTDPQAKSDLDEWQISISRALPGGSGQISSKFVEVRTSPTVQRLEKLTVRITWNDARRAASSPINSKQGLVLEGYRVIQ